MNSLTSSATSAAGAEAIRQLEVMETAAVPADWIESPSRSISALLASHVANARMWDPADLCDFRIRVALVCLRWNQYGKAQWFTLAALDTLHLMTDPSAREKTGGILAQLGKQWRMRHGLFHAHRCLCAAVELQDRTLDRDALTETLDELGIVLSSMGHAAEATDSSGQRCG